MGAELCVIDAANRFQNASQKEQPRHAGFLGMYSETSHFALDRNDDDNKDTMTGARATSPRARGVQRGSTGGWVGKG